jgi:phosphoesterase RecJ-like protein
MSLKKINEIINLIRKNNKFLITSHVSPDGDNLGSVTALKLALEQMGKKAVIIIDDTLPSSFSFLPDIDKIISYESDMEVDFDLCFILDCSDFKRIARVEELLADKTIINIDHHGDNPSFGDYNLLGDVAATAELVYQLISEIEEIKMDKEIATAIATGLITDTGSFRYSNTTAQTHQIMADLLTYNVNTAKICKEVFDTYSYASLKLKGKVLENLKVDDSGKVAWIEVSQDLLKDTGSTLEDADGLVDYPRSLAGVEIGVLFKEVEDGTVRVSLRSNYYFSVDKIAHQFGGGGHAKAAGCTINDTLIKAEDAVISTIKKELSQVN